MTRLGGPRRTKTKGYTSERLNKCADIWDNLTEEIGDQILHELGVDDKTIQTQDYIKPRTSSNGFWAMLPKFRKIIFDEYTNYDGNYHKVSETFNDIIYQIANPKILMERNALRKHNQGTGYPKQIQEIADFWRTSLESLNEEGDVVSVHEKILNELGLDSTNYSDIGSKITNFSNMKKEYQIKIYESCYDVMYKEIIKSKTLAECIESVELIPDKYNVNPKPKSKQAKVKPKKPINLNVMCWNCETQTKILSLSEAFDCNNCKEKLWIGDQGYEKVGDMYR